MGTARRRTSVPPDVVVGEEGRSARKRRMITEAATTVFLRNGYLGTNMDEIAALAGVSKQTVYKHFADKERLFTEVLLGTIGKTQGDFAAATLEDTDDLERDLHELARRLVVGVIRPEMLQLRRIVIGEADRFPDVARLWYENGPERTAVKLATRFTELAERGLLRVDDPLLAAQHFNWLVLSVPLNKLMFCGSDDLFTPADLQRFADEGVRVFLAAYGAG